MDNLWKEKSKLMKTVLVLVILSSVYVAAKIVTEVKGYKFIGGGAPASNVISFEGKGEISAAPDLATISFTLRDSQKELKNAQDKVTAKESAVLKFLDSQKIDRKDIKTENYSSYPKYDYQRGVCPPIPLSDGSAGMTVGAPSPYYCPDGKQVLTGYEVSEYISVKVRDLAKAGEIVKGLGALGVSEMNGPNFSIDNEDGLKAQARKLAIDDAKAKAKVLSRDLGVRLVRIVNFSENGNYPMMYGAGMAVKDSVMSAPAPELPTGENKITSNVTITYEIR